VEKLREYRQKNNIDWVIANGENLAGGIGITKKTMEEMLDAGVDVITSGNHVFKKEDAEDILSNKKTKVLRPANYPPDVPGMGWKLFENDLGQRIIVINLIGRVFFRENFDCPFRTADQILAKEIKAEGIDIDLVDAILVDFHAEATGEKAGLANYLDGRISALAGTHTHVATADERILENGTAFVSDLGMTGVIDSNLGVDKKVVIKQFLTQLPKKFMWKTSGPTFSTGVVINLKKGSIKPLSIKRFLLKTDN
jgi:hypothetical protein